MCSRYLVIMPSHAYVHEVYSRPCFGDHERRSRRDLAAILLLRIFLSTISQVSDIRVNTDRFDVCLKRTYHRISIFRLCLDRWQTYFILHLQV